MTEKPTEYRGALDLIHEWVESEDDMLPEDLEPEALAWLIRKLGQERDAALAYVSRVKAAWKRYEDAEYLSDEEIRAEEELYTLMEETP